MTIWMGMFGATYSIFTRGDTEHVQLSSSMNTGKGWDLHIDSVRRCAGKTGVKAGSTSDLI